MPRLVCYAQPGKEKSVSVCTAFSLGCGGAPVRSAPPPSLEDGAAMFYGVVGIENLFQQAVREKRDWYYADNSYFDRTRGKHFRVARNSFQLTNPTPREGDHARAKALGINVQPWQRNGRHIVVVEQSPHFLSLSGAGGAAWLPRVLRELKDYTCRPVLVRPWNRDKGRLAPSLREDLQGAHALVTHMSAAANEALLAGIPVYLTGHSAASPLASGKLFEIESPSYPDGREEWAAALAANQWTLRELRDGVAWRRLHG